MPVPPFMLLPGLFGSTGAPAVPFEPGMLAVPGEEKAPEVVSCLLALCVLPDELMPELEPMLLERSIEPQALSASAQAMGRIHLVIVM